VLSVMRQKEATVVPDKGSIVAGQVDSSAMWFSERWQITKVNPRFASVRILCVGNVPLQEGYTGMIRYSDYRKRGAEYLYANVLVPQRPRRARY
jgi:hypothetical protein